MVRRPAEAVALRFETGLLDVIVDSQLEVASTPENGERVGRSTILPLLEFALTRLWDRRQDGVLTHAAYNAIGGVVGGLTQWADLAYCSLPQEQRLLARRVLTELVHLGDESQGLPDSRRRKSLTALARGEAEQAGTLDQVIQQLANARLLVTERDPSTGQESVEIIHEALLREWKTFQDWLAKDRQFLTWRQEIEPRVRAWNETNPDQIAKRDEGKLLRGGDLVVAAGWLAERGADLTQGEREYCQASIALHEREAAQQERQRQLERTRNRIIGLLGALGVVVALIAVVFWSRSARLAAERQSLALAGSASRALDDRNPDLALALALKASAIKAPPEAARIALIEAAYLSSTRRRMSVGEGWVLDVDISPDGLYLVSGSSAGRVSLWNLGSGGEIQRFIPGTPSGPAWSVAFSPDGRAILAGYESGNVILWNISTGTAMLTMKGHTAAVRGLAFTPDGHTAVTGSLDKSLILWDVANGQRVRTFTGHKGAILSVDMSPDGKTIVSGSEDKTLIVWDSTSGEVIRQLSGHSGYVLCVAFSPDGNLILSGSADSSLRLWSTQTGAELRVLKGHTNWVHSVVFSPDGRSALSASADRSLMLWDISAGRMAQQLDGHSDEVQSVAIAHDGDLAVSGARDSSLRVWDIRAFKETGGSSQSMGAEITSVAVDPSGARLLTGLSDGRIALWSTRSGTVLKELPPHSAVVSSVAFSPDGHQALTGSHDMTLALWDVAAGAQIHSLKRQTGAIRSVTFSHDGRAALAGTIDAKVAFWDFAGSAPRYFEGHTNIVTAVRSSPDGKTAVSGSHDHSLILWDLDSGRQIRRYLGHDSWVLGVDFSPDGQTIVSASADRTLILWETGTGRIIHRLRGHDGMVLSVSFSPDGQTLLSGSSDGMLILWSTASGRPLRRFNFLPDASCALDERCWWVWGVAFSPQADRVFSGSADGRWRTWPVLPSDVDQLRNWVQQNRYTRALTPQEQQQYGISDQ